MCSSHVQCCLPFRYPQITNMLIHSTNITVYKLKIFQIFLTNILDFFLQENLFCGLFSYIYDLLKLMILELVRRRARQLSNDAPVSIEVVIGFCFFCTTNSSCFVGVLTFFFNDSYIAAKRNRGVVF